PSGLLALADEHPRRRVRGKLVCFVEWNAGCGGDPMPPRRSILKLAEREWPEGFVIRLFDLALRRVRVVRLPRLVRFKSAEEKDALAIGFAVRAPDGDGASLGVRGWCLRCAIRDWDDCRALLLRCFFPRPRRASAGSCLEIVDRIGRAVP